MTHTVAKFETYLLLVGTDIVDYLLSTFAGKYAQIDTADTHIGTDATLADANQHTMHVACVGNKYLAKLLLYQSCYFVLSCTIHLFKLKIDN